jgi:hypothetical protein
MTRKLISQEPDLGTINHSAGKFSCINTQIKGANLKSNSINKSYASLLVVFIYIY